MRRSERRKIKFVQTPLTRGVPEKLYSDSGGGAFWRSGGSVFWTCWGILETLESPANYPGKRGVGGHMTTPPLPGYSAQKHSI